MKKIVFLVLAFFLVFLSCTKDEKPVLTISQSSISAPSAGNSISITLVANNPWSVSGTDWCTVSPSSGQGGGEVTVTITVKENTTYDARNHTLTFISKELSQSLSVNQESNYGIVLPKNTYELSSDAQQISVEVKANVTYEVSIDADWIKENGTKALTSKAYTFDIEANSSYDSRDGVITIKEKDGSNVETIKVKQAQKDAIIISSKEYSLSSEAQTLEVKLQTNIDLEVVIPDDAKSWVSHTETKALSDKALLFAITFNSKNESRNCSIIITNQKKSVTDTIRITQLPKIKKLTDYYYSYEGFSIEGKFKYDENNRAISYTCRKGESYDKYTYVINFTYKDDKCILPQGVTITEYGLIKSFGKSAFTYNSSNQLVEYCYDQNNMYRFSWENNKIVQVADFYTTNDNECKKQVYYSDQTFEGYFPDMFELLTGPDLNGRDPEPIPMLFPELVGMKICKLPNKIVEDNGHRIYEMTYSFNNENYISMCTIDYIISNNDGSSLKYKAEVTFKWE